MHKFKKITIIGVGLLGGSIGLVVKKKKLAGRVIGYFRHKNKIADAVKRGVVDEGTDDFNEAVINSDLIILCSPVSDIIKKLGDLKKMRLENALITDTGSTKLKIADAGKGLNFIGSHPLAGSEQSGLSHARADLFNDSLCILTPVGSGKSDKPQARLVEFWKALGTKTIVMSPEKHDRVISFASHLPHALAFSLIDAIPNTMIPFGAGGLKDTTRIALSNPDIWIDIFFSNRQNILKSVDSLQKSLQRFKKALTEQDRKKMLAFLSGARTKRKGLTQKP